MGSHHWVLVSVLRNCHWKGKGEHNSFVTLSAKTYMCNFPPQNVSINSQCQGQNRNWGINLPSYLWMLVTPKQGNQRSWGSLLVTDLNCFSWFHSSCRQLAWTTWWEMSQTSLCIRNFPHAQHFWWLDDVGRVVRTRGVIILQLKTM